MSSRFRHISSSVAAAMVIPRGIWRGLLPAGAVAMVVTDENEIGGTNEGATRVTPCSILSKLLCSELELELELCFSRASLHS